MQPIEVRQRQEHLAPKRLQAAAGIAGAVAQDSVAHAIGDARLDFLETGILAPDALAGGKACAFAALLDRRNQIRQECRIVLSVAVEGRDNGAARRANPAAYRRRLARRRGMADLPEVFTLAH